MGVLSLAQRLQAADQLVPRHWRLPLRYRMQAMLGGLEPEIAELPRLLALRPGGLALDIGANVGIYTYALARAGASVHAFEPQLACCEVISAWAEANSRDGRIVVHHAGAGASSGEMVLHVPVSGGRAIRTRASFEPLDGEQIEMRVRIVQVDALGLDRVGFIKIDVEGHELPVLRGALGILHRDHPVLLIEIDRERHTPASVGQIVELLAPAGYRCHVLAEGELRDLDNDPWHAPAGIYNFIFMPRTGHDE